MPILSLPPEVRDVFKAFYTCEFTTVNSQGQPLTWPTEPYYNEPEGQIIVTSSISFPVKTYNARRYPKVSLLYSDPTGSKIDDAPAVLVQGDVTSVEELVEDPPWSYEMFKESIERQPNMRKFVANPLAQKLFMFEYQRIGIFVRPHRILVWAHRDFRLAPTEVEVGYVE